MSDGVCRDHWNYLRNFLTHIKPSVIDLSGARPVPFPADYLDDYTRIRVLMEDETGFQRCLERLSSEVASGLELYNAGQNDDLDTDRFTFKDDNSFRSVQLSRILSYYEGLCYFPDNHANFASLLSAESFTWSLRQGLMPKDPGAGARHGDFSHRFQWHFVMRTVTDNFQVPVRPGWNHTPLELFVHLGTSPATDVSMFFYLFDNNNPFNSSKLNNPDKVHEILKNSTFEPLKTYIGQRATKRENLQNEAERERTAFLDRPENSTLKDWLSRYRQPGRVKLSAAGIASVIYAWRHSGGLPNKVGQQEWLNRYTEFRRDIPADVQDTPANRDKIAYLDSFMQYLNERVAYNVWQTVTNNGKPPKIVRDGKYNQAKAIGTGVPLPGILVKPGAIFNDIEQRLSDSRNQLNPKYRMTSRHGAIPT